MKNLKVNVYNLKICCFLFMAIIFGCFLLKSISNLCFSKSTDESSLSKYSLISDYSNVDEFTKGVIKASGFTSEDDLKLVMVKRIVNSRIIKMNDCSENAFLPYKSKDGGYEFKPLERGEYILMDNNGLYKRLSIPIQINGDGSTCYTVSVEKESH